MEEQRPPETEPPADAEKSEWNIDMLFQRKRVLAFGISLLVVLVLFLLAIVVPADPSFRQTLVTVANSSLPSKNVSAQALIVDIAKNNARVALLEMIPGFGFFFLPLSIFASGVIIQGLALSQSIPPSIAAVNYVLLPFTYVELSAYALAFVSGTMLIVAWRNMRLRTEARVFVLELVAVVIIVIVAAVMETITIFSAAAGAPVVGLLLWAPLIGAVVPLVMRIRRVNG